MTRESTYCIGVVEDDTSYARAIERLMRSYGFQAKTYASGEAFLHCSSIEEFDCLVLDIHLPGLSGFEVAQRLSEMGHNTPTIFMTALKTENGRKRAMHLGAICYLSKPFHDQSLLDALHWATGKDSPTDRHPSRNASCAAGNAQKRDVEEKNQNQTQETP